tara:strand:- start:389 stop:733 length:345 start_codon:yes stop_codon:yes gene_type:complete
MNTNIVLGILLFALAQSLGWFQLNLQILSDWWKGRPLLTAVICGVPCSLFFIYAWRTVVTETGSVWTARFIGSSVGLFLFPVLTWTLLGESMFTYKTMSCLLLAVLILFIQLYY